MAGMTGIQRGVSVPAALLLALGAVSACSGDTSGPETGASVEDISGVTRVRPSGGRRRRAAVLALAAVLPLTACGDDREAVPLAGEEQTQVDGCLVDENAVGGVVDRQQLADYLTDAIADCVNNDVEVPADTSVEDAPVVEPDPGIVARFHPGARLCAEGKHRAALALDADDVARLRDAAQQAVDVCARARAAATSPLERAALHQAQQEADEEVG
jgi:hypothetical protein